MASGKTLQSTIEISGVLSPSLQAAIRSAVDRLEEMSEETLASAGAAEKLSAEIAAQESVLKSLQKGYADFVVSGSDSSEEAQTLADKIQELSGELDENRDTLKAAEKAAKGLTDVQGEAGDAFAKLEKKINSQEDELTALRRQYANVALEQGESSDEARKLANKISSLSRELKENKQKLNEAEKAAQSYGDTLEETGGKAENSAEGYTVLKDVIADLAADAIRAAVEGFKELAIEGDNALAKLEARTGATGEEMKYFEDVMYEVYNSNYGESLGDVSETLSTVLQMTDNLDKASLAKVTKNSIALSDVFGFDTTESLRAVNSLMDQFGITSDEAYNLIVQGAQNGLDQNGDLLDTINEYSVQFRTAGYSADDMFNMLLNGADTGTWSVDKLGDAVKEFNIRMSDGTANDYLEELGVDVDSVMQQFNKGGPEAQKAIGTVMDAILECDDATLQYQTGVGLFGTMWEDLGADTVASLMQTEGAIDSASDAMAKMDEAAYDTLEGSLSQLGRTIKAEIVKPIADKLVPVAKDAVEFVTTKVGPAVDWILDHLPEIGIALGTVGAAVAAIKWGTIVSKVTQVIGAIKGVIAAIGAVAAPVWIIIAAVAVLAAAFTHLWKNNEEFRNKITAIWEEVKGKFEQFGQTITDKLNELGFDFESFSEVVGAIWDGFCNLLGPVFEGVFQHISNYISYTLDYIAGVVDIFVGIFTGDWQQVWDGVKGIFGATWEFIVNTFTNWLNTLKGVADVVLGWFGTSWEEVWGSVRDFFVNIWDSITSFLSTTWETIKNVVQVGVMLIGSILSAAFQIITLPFRFIWENCKEYVFAAWEWIKDKVSTAINAVKSVISSVMNSIRSVLSTVWNSIKSVTGNVWNGIKSVISGVWDGIKSRVSSAASWVGSKLSGTWSSIKSTASNMWNSVKNAILNPIEAAKDKIKGIVDSIEGFFRGMNIKIPKIKLPHFKISGEFSISPPSVPKLSIDWYKEGGIMTQPTVFGAAGNTLMAGGEAGAEAVLPLTVLWEKLETILRRILSGETETGEPIGGGLTGKAGELLTLDDFSLGSLANSGGVVYYYDFSHFTWSPELHMGGDASEDEDDFMTKLKAHEAEFFDWLEEFIKAREEALYA